MRETPDSGLGHLTNRLRSAARNPRSVLAAAARRLDPPTVQAPSLVATRVRDIARSGPGRPGVTVVLTVRHDQGAFVPHRLAELDAALPQISAEHEVIVAAYQGAGLPAATALPTAAPARASLADLHDDWTSAFAAGASRAAFSRVLVLDAAVEIDSSVIVRLVGLHDGGVTTPVVRGTDDVVLSAGAFRPHRSLAPADLLEGHPYEDAEIMGAAEVFGATQPVFVTDLVDLPERLPETSDEVLAITALTRDAGLSGGRGVTSTPVGRVYRVSGAAPRRLDAPAAELVAAWSDIPADSSALGQAGLSLDAVAGARVPVRHLVRPARPVVGGGRVDPAFDGVDGLPRLRWSIKIAAHPGARGDDWGDLFFARDLANALRRLGQRVVIDHRQAHSRPWSEHLDDVSLTLRGLDVTTPSSARTNILWVISHPELVSRDELSLFDLRYSAGAAWAERTTASTGLPVETLLQATDPNRFAAGAQASDVASDVLFIGKTRLVFRPIVRDALQAGADLTLYGEGWAEFVDADSVAGEFVSNDDLPGHYRGARIVLNDHWADMRDFGFFSNRLFDAASAGARIVSDDIAGITDVFGPSVQAYSSPDDLRRLLSDDQAWAPDSEIQANARRIGAEHSFDARARRLMTDVVRHRS